MKIVSKYLIAPLCFGVWFSAWDMRPEDTARYVIGLIGFYLGINAFTDGGDGWGDK